MSGAPMRGAEHLPALLGRRVVGLHRWVFALGRANDEFGHGVTTLVLDNGALFTIETGPLEEYIAARPGEADSDRLPREHWTPVDLVAARLWRPRRGAISGVELFTDGVDDVAIRLQFRDGDPVVFALIDTDLILAESLDVFRDDPSVTPVLRCAIQ